MGEAREDMWVPAPELCRPRTEEGNVEGGSGGGADSSVHSLTGKGSKDSLVQEVIPLRAGA